MPTPTTSIRELLGFQQPLSNSERLQLVKIAIDQLLLQIFEGEPIVYLEVRNRRVQVSDPKELLEKLRRYQEQLEEIVGRESGRSQRNYAVIGKPGGTIARIR